MRRRQRGRFEGSIRVIERRAKDGSKRELWEGRVSLGLNGEGKPIRKSVYAATKTDVIKAMNRIRLAPSVLANPEKISLAELLDTWLAGLRAEGSLRPASIAFYESAATHLREKLGRLPLPKIGEPAIRRALSQIDSISARAAAHTTLKVALKHAVREGLITSIPMANIKKPKVERKEKVRTWTEDEARRVLAAASETEWLAVYALGLGAGLRRGEIFALRWRDVDLDRGMVRVERSLSEVGGKFSIELPKTKSSARTVDLPRQAVDALRARAPADVDLDGLVFTDSGGGFVRRSNFDRRVHAAVIAAAGVPACTMHELRHTHASMLLAAGESVKLVSARLGHADPAMTLRVYVHLMPTAQASAAAKIGEMLTPAEAPKRRKAKR